MIVSGEVLAVSEVLVTEVVPVSVVVDEVVVIILDVVVVISGTGVCVVMDGVEEHGTKTQHKILIS